MPNIINIPELKGTLRFLPKLTSKWPCFPLRSPNSHDATRVPPRIKHKQGSTPSCSPNLQVSSTSAASSTLHSRTCAISFLDFNPRAEDPALPGIYIQEAELLPNFRRSSLAFFHFSRLGVSLIAPDSIRVTAPYAQSRLRIPSVRTMRGRSDPNLLLGFSASFSLHPTPRCQDSTRAPPPNAYSPLEPS